MTDMATPEEGDLLIIPSSVDHPLYEQVVEAIRSVYDPEIPVNIYDPGLVYTIENSDDGDSDVLMTLTAPGCPVAGETPGSVAEDIEPLPGIRTVNVMLVWTNPWRMDLLSD